MLFLCWTFRKYFWCSVHKTYPKLTAICFLCLVIAAIIMSSFLTLIFTSLRPPLAITQRASGPYVLLLFHSFTLSFFQREISAVSRPIAAKLCRMIGNWCNFRNQVQNLGVLSPQKIWSRKKMLFSGVISDDFAIRSRMSPERKKISTIGKRRCKLRSLPRLLTESGELWSTNGEK